MSIPKPFYPDLRDFIPADRQAAAAALDSLNAAVRLAAELAELRSQAAAASDNPAERRRLIRAIAAARRGLDTQIPAALEGAELLTACVERAIAAARQEEAAAAAQRQRTRDGIARANPILARLSADLRAAVLRQALPPDAGLAIHMRASILRDHGRRVAAMAEYLADLAVQPACQ